MVEGFGNGWSGWAGADGLIGLIGLIELIGLIGDGGIEMKGVGVGVKISRFKISVCERGPALFFVRVGVVLGRSLARKQLE